MDAAVPMAQNHGGSPLPVMMYVPSGPGGAAPSLLAHLGFQHHMYPPTGYTHQQSFVGFSPPPMAMTPPQQQLPREAAAGHGGGGGMDPLGGGNGGGTLVGAAGAMEVGRAEPEMTEKQQKRKALMPFIIISLSYLLFTITDGSVRMIVLLHA